MPLHSRPMVNDYLRTTLCRNDCIKSSSINEPRLIRFFSFSYKHAVIIFVLGELG